MYRRWCETAKSGPDLLEHTQTYGVRATPQVFAGGCSSKVTFSSTFRFFRRSLAIGPTGLTSPTCQCAQCPSSGQRPPPYAMDNRSKVSLVPKTGTIAFGLFLALRFAASLSFVSCSIRSNVPEGYSGGCGWVTRDGRGGTEPERRISDSVWSRWA